MWQLDHKEGWAPKNWCFWTMVLENSWESLGEQGDQTSQFWRKSTLNINWKDRCWSWNSNIFAIWYKELTHWKRPWFWERLRAWGEGDNRGWIGWMASPTQWTWIWVYSVSWWWRGRPGILQSWGYKEFDMTEQLNWTEHSLKSDLKKNNLGHIWPGWIKKPLKHVTPWHPEWSIITSGVWRWLYEEALEACRWSWTLHGDKLVNVFKWCDWTRHWSAS